MTLIAAFTVNDVPVLVGDMLITEDPSTLPSVFLPTRPDLRGSQLSQRRRSDTHLKLLVLNKRLAVGFSGTVLDGAILFDELEKRFSKNTPTQEQFNDALRTSNIARAGRASLVGWLACPAPRCFRWVAKPGSQVEWVSHAAIGSGAVHFLKQILNSDNPTQSNLSGTAIAVFKAIAKIGSALSHELSDGSTFENNYGYGMEAVVWNGRRFEYQDKITFVFFNMLVRPNKPATCLPVLIRIYDRKRNYALLQTHPFGDHLGPDGSVGTYHYLEAVTPLHVAKQGIHYEGKALDPRSPIYSVNIAFTDGKKFGKLYLTLDSDGVLIQGNAEKCSLRLKHADEIVDIARRDLTK